MVQSSWDSVARCSGEEESTTTWHRTSAGGIRRIKIIRKLAEGKKLLGGGQELNEVPLRSASWSTVRRQDPLA